VKITAPISENATVYSDKQKKKIMLNISQEIQNIGKIDMSTSLRTVRKNMFSN